MLNCQRVKDVIDMVGQLTSETWPKFYHSPIRKETTNIIYHLVE